MSAVGTHTIFYDGVCGLCNRSNTFVLRRDRHNRFRFAALQSEYARRTLRELGRDPDDMDTMVVLSADGQVYTKAPAWLFIVRELGGIWRAFTLFGILPRALLNWLYDRVARSRYRIFGRYDTCPIPSPQDRAKFMLDA
jgi:predicted DCC family thiol-disulfide oxidoreductase YuxK